MEHEMDPDWPSQMQDVIDYANKHKYNPLWSCKTRSGKLFCYGCSDAEVDDEWEFCDDCTAYSLKEREEAIYF